MILTTVRSTTQKNKNGVKEKKKGSYGRHAYQRARTIPLCSSLQRGRGWLLEEQTQEAATEHLPKPSGIL